MNYNIIIDDMIGGWGYSKQYVRSQLADYKGKPVNVLISSLGGSVDHALDIRQQFIDHGNVTVYLNGFVASAATIISMGAKTVKASKYSMYLVHKCSNWIDEWGNYNADQIQALIDKLKQNKLDNEKVDIVIASMYADKCKKKVTDILDILKAGNWMTATEAHDLGFVDEIIEDDEDIKVDAVRMNRLCCSMGYPAIPSTDNSNSDSEAVPLLNKIINKIDSLMHSGKNAGDVVDINIKTMKKDYEKVNTILKVEGVEVDKEGKVTLTEEQIKALNDRINTLESDVKAKDDTIKAKEDDIKSKQTEIDNLKKAPGDDTKAENADEEDEKEDGKTSSVSAKDMYNNVKDFI